jgi:hypothetical protein
MASAYRKPRTSAKWRRVHHRELPVLAVCRPPYGFRGRTKRAFGAVCIITHPAPPATKFTTLTSEPSNLKLVPTAYGMGLVSYQDGPRVMTFAPITSPAMWSQWLAKARGTATPTDEELNPYQHMLTTMGPVLMESIQSVGHVCDRTEAIALNDALAVKYYHVTCNGSLRYTVGVGPTRTLVLAGDLSGY